MHTKKHQVTGVDQSRSVRIDYNRCVGCQMCAMTCNDQQKIGAIATAPLKTPPFPQSISGKNAENTETTRVKLSDTCCIGCGQCVTMCSTGAIEPANRTAEIEAAKKQGLTLVAVMAPATRLGIAEGMKMPIGTSAEAQTVAGLRQLGFQYVFDNLWGADATTMEDAKELLEARKAGKHGIFTSCCPAWINLAETRYPEVIPQLSTARSPNGMICSCIKKFWAKEVGKKPEDLFVVSFLPCTAKKFEIERPQLQTHGIKDCDLAVTSRELVGLFAEAGLKFTAEREEEFQNKPEAKFDAPFNTYSGSAYIFGKTGGVTESVARYVLASEGHDWTKAKINKTLLWESQDKLQSIIVVEFAVDEGNFRVLTSHGGAAAEELMKIYQAGKLQTVDCIEVMMCPQGCVGGGGQPRLPKKSMTVQRPQGLDKHDQESAFRTAAENTQLIETLKKWAPTDADHHDCLHTYYTNRRFK